MEYVRIQMKVQDAAQSERLVALLSELPVEGFEEKEDSLELFAEASGYNRDFFHEILQGQQVEFTESNLDKINWNSEWESNYQPVEVEHPLTGRPFVHIRASFHPPVQGVPYEILINPKMSFGTGHHATTCLMMQEMAHLDLKGKRVIDFGTGTGILGVLAEKMGADEILGIDIDPWSIENGRENAELNNCSLFSLEESGCFPESDRADIILANINLNVISENFNSIKNSINKGGDVIFSGIMREDEPNLTSIIREKGLEIISKKQRGEWSLIHCKSVIP